MRIKGLIDEDFIQYKKPSMFLIFPTCTFKCEKECGERVCQNGALVSLPDIEISIVNLIERYMSSNISQSVVAGGLEPFDHFDDLRSFIQEFRKYTKDDVVIYTGYTENEAADKVEKLKQFKNIIVKYGRFIPNQQPHRDEVLGVNLASDNQYAKKIS